MPMRIIVASAFTASTMGCLEVEADCFSLTGGFEGADTGAIEGECLADARGSGCDADDFIESDAAKCLVAGSWSDEVDLDFDATIGYSYGYRTVIWSVFRPSDSCSSIVHASTGDLLGSACSD